VLTEDWIPHIPVAPQGSSVYASQFTNGETRLWLLVNRGLEDKDQDLRLPCSSASASWVDLYHGVVMNDWTCNEDEGVSFLARLKIEAGGIGAVFLTEDPFELVEFLATMAEMTAVPLSSFSAENVFAMQTMEDLTPELYSDHDFSPKSTSILVPGGRLNFTVTGNAIECYDPACPVDVQYPWEDRPSRWHSSWVDVPDLYVDQHLVTDAEFSKFMSESNWRPADEMNFLRHWPELEDASSSQRPVNWVSAWDAAAYCAWQGARLPHSWEWQWFAQGNTSFGWPWGNDLDDSKMPPFTSDPKQPLAEPVGGFPEAASWAGIEDLVGSVYQWTDVFSDDHTSRAVLRGSPRWRPNGRDMFSSWYQPLPYGTHWTWPDVSWATPGPAFEQNTMLLLSDSMDRSGGIGFRCVADVE